MMSCKNKLVERKTIIFLYSTPNFIIMHRYTGYLHVTAESESFHFALFLYGQ